MKEEKFENILVLVESHFLDRMTIGIAIRRIDSTTGEKVGELSYFSNIGKALPGAGILYKVDALLSDESKTIEAIRVNSFKFVKAWPIAEEAEAMLLAARALRIERLARRDLGKEKDILLDLSSLNNIKREYRRANSVRKLAIEVLVLDHLRKM